MLTALFLFGMFHLNAQLQRATVGESYIEVKGPGIDPKKIVLTEASVNWYKKQEESNVNVRLRGTNKNIKAFLDIGWNSNEKKIVFHKSDKKYTDFYYFYEGDFGEVANYELNREDDEVIFLIEEINATNLSFFVEGHVTTKDGPRVMLSGHISLKKNAAPTIVTAKFGDCDPVVYDQYSGSQVRSPSDCELKFITYLNEQFLKAVIEPVRDHFEKIGYEPMPEGGWGHTLPISTHKNFYDGFIGLEDSKLKMKNSKADSRYTDILDSLKKAESAKGVAEEDININDLTLKAFRQADKEQDEGPATSFTIICRVNLAGQFCFGGKMQLKKLSDGVCIIQTGKKVTVGGEQGGACNPLEPGWTMGLLGHLKEPTIVNRFESAFDLKLQPVFRPGASHLSVQSVVIEIHTDKNLSDEIVKLINWDKLKSMIEK